VQYFSEMIDKEWIFLALRVNVNLFNIEKFFTAAISKKTLETGIF